jgi:hypothetical protein
MKASCSLASRDTAGDPSPKHKIRGCVISLEDSACNMFPALSRFRRMVQTIEQLTHTGVRPGTAGGQFMTISFQFVDP